MRKPIFALLGLWLALTTAVEAGTAPAVVQVLQAPAWRTHVGARSALRAGEALASGDSIATGAGARVVLSLSEGSLVKLGENAELALNELVPPADDSGAFKGFLDVVRGAFRFTTAVVGRKRDIRARLNTATIGIRGTDVWGKSEDARDFAVLLEGHVTIERDGQSFDLAQPNSLFMAPRGQAALPIGPVDPKDLAVWAQETEPQAGAGQTQAGGKYRLMVKTSSTAAVANKLLEKLSLAGYGADVVPSAGLGWRVSIAGFSTEADAETGATALVTELQLARPWIAVEP